MNRHPLFKNHNIKAIFLIPIILLLVLMAGGGQTTNIQAANVNATCFEVFLPVVIGSGSGGNGAPSTSTECGHTGNAYADFNGDGYADLAIGVPSDDVFFNGGNVAGAGVVNVIYGSPTGLTATNNQLWHRGSPGIQRDPTSGGFFGQGLAVGDFNKDGYSDLAVSSPNSPQTFPPFYKTGSVHVIFGSSNGLTAQGNLVLEQGSMGLSDSPEYLDNFGSSLTTGDFDGDGFDDLAIGVDGENVSNQTNAGAVHIVYGDNNGFRFGDDFVTQAASGSPNGPNDNDRFGSVLTSGDFNGDGYSDLTVGIPLEDIIVPGGSYDNAGGVQIFYGGADGVVDPVGSVVSVFWHGASNNNIQGSMEDGDSFGYSLDSADFDADGFDDLAVGRPGQDIGAAQNAGAINAFYGSFFGLDATPERPALLWNQDTPGIKEYAEDYDSFGYSLKAADFNNDGYPDLAIGVIGEHNILGLMTGAVAVLYSNQDGLSPDNDTLTFNDFALSENGNQFGRTLAVGDYNQDGFIDLTIGTPQDILENGLMCGSVFVRYSDDMGVTTYLNQDYWTQDSPGILEDAEFPDLFSSTLP